MTIPIDESKWHRVDHWSLPEGHRLEVACKDDTAVARITGPNAHVFADGPDFQTAIDAAEEWFNLVGREL